MQLDCGRICSDVEDFMKKKSVQRLARIPRHWQKDQKQEALI
jgi:hypothetical protein